jgi:hypothetical protein
MYCPNCGQQQISDQTKFCSRCGLPLSLIAEVLAHDGTLPQLAAADKKGRFLNRKNGVAFSALWCLFFLLIMAPFWGIVNVDELAGVSAVIGIFGGLMWLIVSLVFLPSRRSVSVPLQPTQPSPAYVHGQQGYGSLPPVQSMPADVYGGSRPAGNWRDTNDLEPTSVTENTTRLLDKDDR